MTDETNWPTYEPTTGDETDSRDDPQRIAAAKRSPFTANGFFAALADGTLLGGRCTACETLLLPPRPACYECGGRDVELEELSTRGQIVSYSCIRKPPAAFDDLAPFPAAIVELESGARLPGRVDADYEDLAIGDRVRVDLRTPTAADEEFALDHERDWPIHVFVPEGE